jgi:hypothetical protein
MHEELARRDITVAKEEYAIQCEGHYLFAALTTNWLNTRETAAALAFRHSNDKSQAMKMYPVCTCLFATVRLVPSQRTPQGTIDGPGTTVSGSLHVPTGCGLQPTPSPPVRRRRRHPHRGD